MKTLTCKQMGGPCDEKITAGSYKEMMDKGWEHVAKAHPEMAKDIQAMPKDDPKMVEWEKGFKAEYEAAPEM